MQSKLAIMSFSFFVSQANLRGSNISRGLSPPCPFLIISNAVVALSLRGAERLASLEAMMVSRAEAMRTTETGLPREALKDVADPEFLFEVSRDIGVDGGIMLGS